MRGIMLRRALYGALVAGLTANLGACSGGGGVTGTLPLSSVPSIANNTLLANISGSSGAPTAQTLTALGIYANPTIIRASDYGILPSNAATVNDTALAALNAVLIASPATIWEIVFAPGTYQYTYNRWLWGVQNVIIDAWGASFESVATSGGANNYLPLLTYDFFFSSGNIPCCSYTYENGYLINTVTAGSASVTTSTAANAGNFAPGNLVLVYGYDQGGQASGPFTYPPDIRYFEYLTVSTVNSSTGVITFTAPVRNFYDSRWYDVPNYIATGVNAGAPRILNLNRSNFNQAQFVWIRGATFLPDPNETDTYELQVTGNVVIYDNVTAVGLSSYATGTNLIRNSSFIGNQSAGDKFLDRLVISDSVFNGNPGYTASLTDCVGCNNLTVIRSTVYGIYDVSPRNLTVTDSTILPGTGLDAGIATAGVNPLWTVAIGNTRVYNSGNISYGFTNIVSPGNSFTAGSGSGSGVIELTYSATVAAEVDYGMTLTDTTAGISGVVTAIYYSGGNLVIDGTWSTVSSGDTITCYDVMNASDQGGNLVVSAGSSTPIPFWRGPPGPTAAILSNSPTFTNNITVDGDVIFPGLALRPRLPSTLR